MGAPAPMPQPQLPEQQGIGMLPAENVAGMADGGIAGYGDSYADEYANGGMVAFNGKDGSVVRNAPYTSTTDTSLASYFSEGARQDLDKGTYKTSPIGRFFSFLTPDAYTTDTRNQLVDIDNKYSVLRNEYKNLTGAFGFRAQSPQEQARASELERQMAALEQQSSDIRSRPNATVRAEHEKQVAAASTSEIPTPAASQADVRRVDNTIDASTAPAPPRRQTGTGTRTSPGTGTTKDGKAGPVATAPDFVPSKPGDLTAELARLQKMSPGTKAYDDLNAKIKKGYADLETAREKDKPKDKAYAGLEALLAKDEEKAKGKEERNLKMALIGAGLAIAGGKSQYALQNIAEGAQVGTKQYQEGVEKLEAAALERRKQGAMIEEARRAEARGDWKEAQQFKQKAFEAELGVNQAQIAAVQDLYKTDLKTASDIVNNQNTLASADQRALMQQREETKRHESLMRNQRAVAGINAAAYASRMDQRGQITPALALKEYNDNLAKDMYGDFQKKYPTPQHYMAALQQMVNPTVISELPQNATVRN
jgi:hypothetical protein